MPDGSYSQHPDAYRSHPDARSSDSFADKIDARRKERAYGAMSDDQKLVVDLQKRVDALEKLISNLRGENGIDVKVPVIRFTKTIPDGGTEQDGLPAGEEGDMLYHNGTEWVLLEAPSVSTYDPVLRHNGTSPYWEEPEECPTE